MKLTIYETSSGRILRAVVCSEQDAHWYLGNPNNTVVEGEFSSVDNYFKEGRVKVKPPQPSSFHEFDYASESWVDQRGAEYYEELVRSERNRRLAQSDWTQLPDVPLATKEAWAVYRQALRDITDQPDQTNVVWPTSP